MKKIQPPLEDIMMHVVPIKEKLSYISSQDEIQIIRDYASNMLNGLVGKSISPILLVTKTEEILKNLSENYKEREIEGLKKSLIPIMNSLCYGQSSKTLESIQEEMRQRFNLT